MFVNDVLCWFLQALQIRCDSHQCAVMSLMSQALSNQMPEVNHIYLHTEIISKQKPSWI